MSTDARQRFDFGRLSRSGKVVRLPSGGARIPANLTRTGVFLYRNPDGSDRRELRLPEEVFKADSLETLRDATVIEGHPDMVRSDNWKELSRGHVSGLPRADGQFVASDLAIQDAGALDRIDSGELSEISCGYTCRDDMTSGVWNGERYDLIQRDIKYNHVGLGPKNWGRAGNEVGLRLDSASVCVFDETTGAQTPKVTTNMKIRFDGVEYDACSTEHVLALTNKIDGLNVIVEAAKKKAADEEAEKDKASAKCDAALEDLKALQAKFDDATSVAKLDAAVAERVALIVDAKQVLGDSYKFDGQSAVKIMTDAILAVKADVKLDGKSEDYIRARFDGLVESGARSDSIEAVPGVVAKVAGKISTKEETARKDAAEQKRKLDAQNTPAWDAQKDVK